jgi:outer membrane protein OmpA-like peptidoglycan-associated protein
MLKRLLPLALAVASIASCSEDLAPITRLWTETLSSLSSQLSGLGKTLTELKNKASALAAPNGDDKEGVDLKSKLDGALTSLETGLSDAQKAITTGTTAVNEAMTQGKVAGVQAAIDKVKTNVGGALEKLKPQLKAAEGLLADFERAAMMAEKAKSAGSDASGPPSIDASQTAEADYDGIAFKSNSADLDTSKPSTKVNLDSLVSLMKSCKEITVEVEGHTSKVGDAKKNKELSAKRAQAVTRHLINVGEVSPSQIKKTFGYGSTKPAMEEPDVGSEAEKTMDPKKLAAIRARNERIHLRILKPCPAKK